MFTPRTPKTQLLTRIFSIPQDPDSRSLIVGVCIAFYYSIGAWSQVLVWPASQAPYYKYGWQSCIACWVLCMTMTVVLRYVDVKFMLPKRLAFAAGLDSGEILIAGHSAAREGSVDGEEDGDAKKGAEVAVKSASVKDAAA